LGPVGKARKNRPWSDRVERAEEFGKRFSASSSVIDDNEKAFISVNEQGAQEIAALASALLLRSRISALIKIQPEIFSPFYRPFVSSRL
jgi:hypothetical protein